MKSDIIIKEKKDKILKNNYNSLRKECEKMKEKNEKKKIKGNKAEIGARILALILAILMIASVCMTFVYYIYTAIAK